MDIFKNYHKADLKVDKELYGKKMLLIDDIYFKNG